MYLQHDDSTITCRGQDRPGDVIWSADLAHGGSEYSDASTTRRSLVTHYCPADTHPMYFHYGDHSAKIPWGERSFYCFTEKILWRAG